MKHSKNVSVVSKLHQEIADLRAEVEKLRRERDELREAICAWAKEHNWCHINWKGDPTNAELFRIAALERREGE